MREDEHQIVVRVQDVLLSGLNEAENGGAGLRSPRGIGKQEILTVDDEGLDGAFGPVVGYLQPPVQQIPLQVLPLLRSVAHSFSEGVLTQMPDLFLEPCQKITQNRFGLLLAPKIPIFVG